MSRLEIYLFGSLRVQSNGQVLAGLDAGKVQELFCYLLLNRQQPHLRETLAGRMWPDSSAAQSRKYLRQTLWQLQTALETGAGRGDPPVLRVESDWVLLNAEASLWLDVAMFEQAFGLVRGRQGQQLDRQRVEGTQNAVDLYQGDLLEGWYQDWCLYERERLQNMYLAMLDKLMEYCETYNQYEQGLVHASRILRYDRAHERTHQRIMRLFYLAGDRVSALRQYHRCLAALQEELGVQPAQSTVALYEQIQVDQLDDYRPKPAEDHPVIHTQESPPAEPGDYLLQFQSLLLDLRARVDQGIQVIEVALNNRHW